ncbi:MAG: AbrB family transcriptional regulator [Clostridioides sp.]|nr:AbrB family transcriptional regulator [Clostridioides sp.]
MSEKLVLTVIIGSLGAYVALKLEMPVGALMGAIIAVGIFNSFTEFTYMPENSKMVAQIILGCILGTGINLKFIMQLKELLFPSIIMVMGLIFVSIIIGIVIYKVTGMDLATALYSCSPGGVTDMTLLAESMGAKATVVALMQLMRLFAIITIFPLVIRFIEGFK